jgi:hypothetical protein
MHSFVPAISGENVLAVARQQVPLPGFTVGAMSDTMLYWLGVVCQEQRKERDRLQVHIAASLDRNQSTVARFERGEGWPRDPDLTIAAYADDLDMEPSELWQLALERWLGEGEQPNFVALKERRGDELEERRAKRRPTRRPSNGGDVPDRLPPLQAPPPDAPNVEPGETDVG